MCGYHGSRLVGYYIHLTYYIIYIYTYKRYRRGNYSSVGLWKLFELPNPAKAGFHHIRSRVRAFNDRVRSLRSVPQTYHNWF